MKKDRSHRAKSITVARAVNARASYIQQVRDALDTDPSEMSRADYIDALEEIETHVRMSLEAAREEQASEEAEQS